LGAVLAAGCAADRDHAAIQPTLARPPNPYLPTSAAAPVTQPAIVGVQPIGDPAANQTLPTYNTTPATLTPQGSTAQPYFAVAPQTASAPPPMAVNQTAPAYQPAPVFQGATGYAAPTASPWITGVAGETVQVHQFSTPTTGSSFIPAIQPAAPITAESTATSGGIVPVSGVTPEGAANGRPRFLSEGQQVSRLPPAGEQAGEQKTPPDQIPMRRLTPPPPVPDDDKPLVPKSPGEEKKTEAPSKQQQRRNDADNIGTLDVPDGPPKKLEAPSAQPPLGGAKTPSDKTAPPKARENTKKDAPKTKLKPDPDNSSEPSAPAPFKRQGT
jgi:hypothetical protein